MKETSNSPNNASNPQIMDFDFERQLLASRLVSEVYRTPDHVSITLTGDGILAFIKAMQAFIIEVGTSMTADHHSGKVLFPEQNKDLIAKKDVIVGLGVSHTTLWKWEKEGYLVPVKVGKRIYYKRTDLENLAK